MSTEQQQPKQWPTEEQPKSWPTGQAQWFTLALRCSAITAVDESGYHLEWCGKPTGSARLYCPEHQREQ